MGNIIDYLRWRGDITFEEKTFNDVDNFIFSQVVYARIEEYMAGIERFTLADAAEAAVRLQIPETEKGVTTLIAAGKTQRFRNVEIYHAEALLHKNTQFGMMCFDVPGNITYVGFRGTDNSISGWREDFAASYRVTIGQRMALEYLKELLVDDGRKYIIGGHSKGANLALYASMNVPKEQQDLIYKVYDNDGPGFVPELINKEGLDALRDRLVMYCPRYCVIGRLLELDIPKIVVQSSEKGMNQHTITGWQVLGAEPVTADSFDPDSESISGIFKDWNNNTTAEERDAFTIDFFDALEKRGAETFPEFLDSGIVGIMSVATSIHSFEPEARTAFKKLLKYAAKHTVHFGPRSRQPKTPEIGMI